MTNLVVREYGTGRLPLITLHGGPAAAGDVAPLARELGKRWHTIEPLQRGSGARPLTVATHIEDLHHVIQERCRLARPVIVGHSWGAMLALAYAAAHPARPAGLVLIGTGTFSLPARAEYQKRLDGSITPADRAYLADLEKVETSAERRLAAWIQVMRRAQGHDVEDVAEQPPPFDAVANEETWADMLRLQHDGTYPASFATIRVPVLMLHGAQDPHPGDMTRDDLRAYIPHLQYCELAACGHWPWLERQARQTFFETLGNWLELREKDVPL